MAGCEPMKVTGATVEAFDRARALLKREFGIDVPQQESGEMSKAGFTVRWQLDFASETGVVTCTKKPFVVPCSLVRSKMEKLLAKVR